MKKSFEVIKEQGEFFLVRDNRTKKEFRVSKKGLSPKVVQSFAEGGMVQPDPFALPPAPTSPLQGALVDAQAAGYQIPNAPPVFVEPAPPAYATPPPSPFLNPGLTDAGAHTRKSLRLPDVPTMSQPPAPAAEEKKGMSAEDKAKEVAELAKQNNPYNDFNAALGSGGNVDLPQFPSFKGGMDTSGVEAATKKEQEANQKAAEAKAAEGQQIAAAQEELQRKQEEENLRFETEKTKLKAQSDQLFKDVQESKVDPNRYWSSKGTGNKIGSVLAMALGAFGSSINRGPNFAMEMIDKTIEQDIQGQRDDLNKKSSLYKMNLEKYGSEMAAHNQTKADLLSIAQTNLNRISAGNIGANAKAQAEQLNMSIEKQKELFQFNAAQALQAHRQQYDMSKFDWDLKKMALVPGIGKKIQDVAEQGARFPNQARTFLSDDQRNRAVKNVDGSWSLATSREAKKEYDQKATAFMNGLNSIQNINAYIDRGAKGSITGFNRQELANVKTNLGMLENALLLSSQRGAATDSDRDLIRGLIGDPTKMFGLSSSARERLSALKQNIEADYLNTRKQYVVGD